MQHWDSALVGRVQEKAWLGAEGRQIRKKCLPGRHWCLLFAPLQPQQQGKLSNTKELSGKVGHDGHQCKGVS